MFAYSPFKKITKLMLMYDGVNSYIMCILRLEKGATYADICAKLKEAAEGPMKGRPYSKIFNIFLIFVLSIYKQI